MDAVTTILILTGIIYILFASVMLYLLIMLFDRQYRYRKDMGFMYWHYRLCMLFHICVMIFFMLTIGITLHIFITNSVNTFYGQVVLFSELIGQIVLLILVSWWLDN